VATDTHFRRSSMEPSSEQTDQTTDRGIPVGGLLIDFLQVVTRHRRFISRFVLVATLGTIVVALLLPKWYKSTASVFPAEKADLLGGLDGIASVAKAFSPSRALSSLGANPETDRYMAILKSGTVIGAVIEKFDLVHVYDISSYPGERTAKELMSNVDFTVESEGNITISVYDRDPQRAADMANFFVEMLNKTNTELMVQNARGNRSFIENRYRRNLDDLRAAEDSLKLFQKRYGVIALPEQTEASIKGAAEIIGQLAAKEVQAGVLRRTLSADNADVQMAQIEIEELQKKLNEMNTGVGAAAGGPRIFVPFQKIPDLGAEYIRRYRNVEIQYKILQFITPLYEQAKVEENRQTPSVLVLDKAGPAERKSKPKVSLYAVIALVISLIVSFIVVFTLELVAKVKAVHPDRFGGMVASLRSDWFGLLPRRRQ
jgi:tyrosine-protein kinase Etk/Wzc